MLSSAGSVPASLGERVHELAAERVRPMVAGEIPLLSVELPEPFRAVFTTRWDSPHLSEARPFDLRDEAGCAARGILAGVLGCLAGGADPDPVLVSPQQVHGVRVAGAAEYMREGTKAPCDGLVVNPGLDAGLAALLVFADCVPVILVGEVDAALVHGGWRGLLDGIVQQGAATMTGPPGLAVIGPSIGPCCYQVDSQLTAGFRRRFGSEIVPREGYLDLWEVATKAAGEVGVARQNVVNPRLCTMCNRDLFFSHRADGAGTGRHGAALWATGV
ncbi:MAG: polyphenol oxidase family protein [Actinobacteria bacterium]|nr:polyphenol oxidase family protein [Actinomycetota bacterium]